MNRPQIVNSKWIQTYFDIDHTVGSSFLGIIGAEITKQPTEIDVWKQNFQEFYLSDEIDLDLYSKHILLLIIIENVILLQKKREYKQDLHKICMEIGTLLEIPSYFIWIFDSPVILNEIEQFQQKHENNNIILQDLFAESYQQLIAHTSRHAKGEFYTHPRLAQLMVENSYKPGMRVLDPACGSGTFLIEIAQKISLTQLTEAEQQTAIMKLTGTDCNPLACIMTRANFFLFTQTHFHHPIIPPIFLTNALFPTSTNTTLIDTLNQRFDLIIGNPPWLVLNRIMSKSEKERVKQLGMELDILIGGKLATSTEMTTIFWSKSVRDYLSESGIIHFVVPASLANAAQHDRFRAFEHVSDVEIWSFDEDAFRIHNLCIKAIKNSISHQKKNQIKWKRYHVNFETHESAFQMTLDKESVFKPVYIKSKNGKIFCGRLIDENLSDSSNKNEIFSQYDVKQVPSIYQKEFRQGASLVPRNLIFVSLEKNEIFPNTIITVKPDTTINPKKYSTWEFKAFETAQIEAEYLFPVAKSTGLLPYLYVEPNYAFLPLDYDALSSQYKMKAPNKPAALEHYKKISHLFEEHIKQGAVIDKLETRLNYGHALTDPRQHSKQKIIYGGVGSIVKAAMVGKEIIDTSLYFYVPESDHEAYYLLGILNSPYVTEYVNKVGSTGANGSLRNIHKHPFDLPWQKFDITNIKHQKIVQFAKEMINYVSNFYQHQIQQNPKTTKKMVQNKLMNDAFFQKQQNTLNEKIKELLPI